VPVLTRDRPTGLTRFGGILPRRLTRYRPPRWWQEIGLTAIGYWLYGLVRNSVPEQATIAERHGRAVQHVQDALHLNFERSLNRWVANHEPVAQVMDYYYATLHFIITIAVLVWLFVAHKRIYRGARTVLFSTTIVALVGFYSFPLAPPRLLPQYHYVDTLVRFHTWGSLADPRLAERSNQYAAMPSLHISWALWCGLTIFACSRILWLRILGLCYPIGTLLVIVGTANHFVLDAVGGAVVLAIGYGIQWLLSGHGAYTPAPDQRENSPS
jgi:PAP2 superfamily